jgi:endonuclease/exonuclease/phosphatase family metal-dependent hydrolase
MMIWIPRLLVLKVVLAICVLAPGPPTADAASSSDVSRRPLRLLTYNLLHGGPGSGFMRDDSHLDVRLEMALRTIQALDPDIIALQEVSQSRQYGDVPEQLAARLGFHKLYAPATDRLFGLGLLNRLVIKLIGFQEGVAILSRFPIIASQVHDLPRCRRWYDPRILLEVTISTPWRWLQVFTSHPSRHADCQIPRVAELVNQRRGEGLSVLMGDLNAGETSVTTALQQQADFVDVFRRANPDRPGLTVYQHIREEAPTVFRRVDYIFVLSGQNTTASVRSSRLVLDQPGHLADGSVLWPSDHYGVFAEIDVSSSPFAEAPAAP